MFCIFKVLLPFLSGWRLQVFVLHSNCWLINRHRSIGPKHLLPVRLLKLFGRGRSSHHPVSTRGSNCKINSFSSHFCSIKHNYPCNTDVFLGCRNSSFMLKPGSLFPPSTQEQPSSAGTCWQPQLAATCRIPRLCSGAGLSRRSAPTTQTGIKMFALATDVGS